MIKFSLGEDMGKQERSYSWPVNWFHLSQEPSGNKNLIAFAPVILPQGHTLRKQPKRKQGLTQW